MRVIENKICMIRGCEAPVTEKDFVVIVWDAPNTVSVRVCKRHKEFAGKCDITEFKPLVQYRCVECDKMIEGIDFDNHSSTEVHQKNVGVNAILRFMKSFNITLEDLNHIVKERLERGEDNSGSLIL